MIGKLVFTDWEVCEQIGSGAFSVVYKIKKQTYGLVQYNALKVLHIGKDQAGLKENFIFSDNKYDSIKDFIESLIRPAINEVRIMSELNGNTNIVGYHDHLIQENDDGTYDLLIRMELLEPLSEYDADTSMDCEQIVKVGTDICTALELCSEKNIIHRDIKPDNIFVSEAGNFKLGDFGVSTITAAMGTAVTQTGTAHYIAPEIISGSAYDCRADQYSLGMALKYLIKTNYDCVDHVISETESSQFSELINVVDKATSQNPNDRFQSASDLKAALEACISPKNKPDTDNSFSGTDSSSKRSGKSRVKATVVGVSVFLFLSLIVIISLACHQKPAFSSAPASSSVEQTSNVSELSLPGKNLSQEQIDSMDFSDNAIKALDISNNPEITSLSFLSCCSSIEQINISNTSVSSFEGLERCIHLRKITADNCKIKSLKGLENTTLLSEVSLNGNGIEDISVLKKSSSFLQFLSFSDNKVSDISCLGSADELVSVIANQNNISDISPLKNKQHMVRICFDNNKLADFDLFSTSPSLKYISLNNNLFKNFSLSTKNEGIYLSLSGNDCKVTLEGTFSGLNIHGCTVSSLNITFKGLGIIIIDYSDSLDYDMLMNCFDIYIIDCPLDKQVSVENKLRYKNYHFSTDAETENKVSDKINNAFIIHSIIV